MRKIGLRWIENYFSQGKSNKKTYLGIWLCIGKFAFLFV